MKHFFGITMVFGAREEGELYLFYNSFLLSTNTFSSTLKAARRIGKERSFGNPDSSDDFQIYLGIDEVFRVKGPLGHGAMLGQTSKYGYKTLSRVRKLVEKEKQFVAFREDCDPAEDGMYIVKFLYFLGTSVPYEDRRALTCLGAVKSRYKKNIIEKAKELGESLEFKNKIQMDGENGIISSSFLEFVGIVEIVPIWEEMLEGNRFETKYKKLKSVRDIDKVTFPNPNELKEFFDNKWYL